SSTARPRRSRRSCVRREGVKPLRELQRRIYCLLHRQRFDDELADEMAFHREMAAKSGGAPLGDALRLREDSREAWGFMWLDRLGQDLRYAFRSMRSSPGFTVAAVLVLGIGIGATVAAFSAFNIVASRPLPVRAPDSILPFGIADGKRPQGHN